MRIQDDAIIVETYADVQAMFNRGDLPDPLQNLKVAALRLCGDHKSEVKQYVFSDEKLEAYWVNLTQSASYMFYNFRTGKEEASSYPANSRPFRPDTNQYIQAADLIVKHGTLEFAISREIGEGWSGITFTSHVNKDTLFTFKDTTDFRMYLSAEAFLLERENVTNNDADGKHLKNLSWLVSKA